MNLQLKQDWRGKIKAQQKNLSQAEILKQSGKMQKKLERLPVFKQAKTVLLFWSLPDEISTHDFIDKWAKEKIILLPVIVNSEIRLRKFCGADHLICGYLNIQEPVSEDFTDFESIEIAIVPALAFDKSGTRLGRGKGFYDRLLPHIKAPKIGICFDFQFVEKLPADTWDIKMDLVITP